MSKQRLFLAMLGLTCIGAPLGAQSTSSIDDYSVTVQNNRDKEVTVYLDSRPFETKLGTVEPMHAATFSLPKWVVRGEERVRILLKPRGDNTLEATGVVSRHGARLALMIPPEGKTERLGMVTSDETTIKVENERDQDALVFFTSGSLFQSLGRVQGEREATFQIPDNLVNLQGQVLLIPVDG